MFYKYFTIHLIENFFFSLLLRQKIFLFLKSHTQNFFFNWLCCTICGILVAQPWIDPVPPP